jgi:hypothetical protein
MERIEIRLRKEERAALRKAAARAGRSVSELVRDTIRKVVLKPNAGGPVAIWDGELRRTAIDHDGVPDEPKWTSARRSMPIASQLSRAPAFGGSTRSITTSPSRVSKR